MKCKKSIMGLAGILILIFHFYMPLSDNPLEQTIYRAAYLGVDLFFFISGYSLARRKNVDYGEFIINRLINVYLPFVLFTIVGSIYSGWKISKFFRIIFGIELFRKGGGSFLWFIPGIMIFYFIAPAIIRTKNKLGAKSFLFLIPGWLAIVLLLQFGFGYTDIFILLNRFPIFIIGIFYDDIREKINKTGLPLIIPELIFGGLLVYKFCSTIRLGKPIADIYYLIAIPFVLALVALFDYANEKGIRESYILKFVGTFTLELYALQMIFGVDIERAFLKYTGNSKILAFMLTLICLILIAYIVSLGKKQIYGVFRKGEKK